jgi:hypothetical protein
VNVILYNPLFYILIVNIFGFIWAIRSWKKNVRERWMYNLRESGAKLIGAAENIHQQTLTLDELNLPSLLSIFTTKEQKVLLLFSENSATQKRFLEQTENLKKVAETSDTKKF